MNGLIRNNFYAMESNLKMSFILAAALVFSPLIIHNPARSEEHTSELQSQR